MKMLYRILLLCWCVLIPSLSALPIESKPLNNNPESWNLSWLVFTPRNSSDPSAEALVSSSDPHVKKSKITPKSIFIAPSSYSSLDNNKCPHGYRIDDNGKCIKTVTINQDDILAARLSDLFGIDDNANNKNTNFDSDYYDDEDKNENSGPLQINLPLSIDVEETDDGKKIEYVIEEKIITMRNLNPKNVVKEQPDATASATQEFTTIVPAPVTEKLISVSTDDSLATATTTVTTEIPFDDLTTTEIASSSNFDSSTVNSEIFKSETDDELTTTIIYDITTTNIPTTTPKITTTSTTTTTTTTEKPPIIVLPSSPSTVEPYKINSVEFMPKITSRKTNRNRGKSGEKRIRRPRPTSSIISPSISKNDDRVILKSQSLDLLPIPKKNRTRVMAKRRKITTTESPVTTTTTTTTTVAPVSHKPFYWLPKGWTIDETKEKPVLIRFWAEQPLPYDERARSHNSRHQRVNSKMPTDNIFREVTMPEMESLMRDN